MKKCRKLVALFLSLTMLMGLAACGEKAENAENAEQTDTIENGTEQTSDSAKAYIEETLNLANNEDQEWTYSARSAGRVRLRPRSLCYRHRYRQRWESRCDVSECFRRCKGLACH